MRRAIAAGNRHTAEAGAWAFTREGNAVDAVAAAADVLLLCDAGQEPTLGDGVSSVAVPGLVAGLVRLSGAILQTIHHVVAACLPVDEAIDQPRLHLEDGVVQIEGGWSDETVRQLQQTGHRVHPWAGWNLYFGGICAVERLPDGHLAATADRRRRGHGVDAP